ncbi:MAG: DUF4249 family protein [Lewinellaceae bacterium]|nr:DUF4249 family protein [Lewinellaceae bacterium]
MGEAQIPETADVSISTKGNFLDKLQRTYADNDGRLYWLSRESPAAGEEYTLVVRIAGLPAVEAASYMPFHANLAPTQILPGDLSSEPLEDGRRLLRVPLTLEVEDMPAEKRFFAFALRFENLVYKLQGGVQVPDYTYVSNAFFLADGRTLSLLHNIPEPAVLVDEKFWNDNRRTLFLDALVPYDPVMERPLRIYVEWRTLSEEFYRYHLSLARQGNNLPLSDPDAVYNNVIGGYGNFSGYSVSVDTLQIPY